MQKFVIEQNIQHFEDLLDAAVAPEDRHRLQAMLDAERAKLRALEDSEGRRADRPSLGP